MVQALRSFHIDHLSEHVAPKPKQDLETFLQRSFSHKNINNLRLFSIIKRQLRITDLKLPSLPNIMLAQFLVSLLEEGEDLVP